MLYNTTGTRQRNYALSGNRGLTDESTSSFVQGTLIFAGSSTLVMLVM